MYFEQKLKKQNMKQIALNYLIFTVQVIVLHVIKAARSVKLYFSKRATTVHLKFRTVL